MKYLTCLVALAFIACSSPRTYSAKVDCADGNSITDPVKYTNYHDCLDQAERIAASRKDAVRFYCETK